MKFILQHLLVMLVFMCSMVIQAQAEEGIKPSSKMLFLGNHDNYPPFSYLVPERKPNIRIYFNML